MKKLIFLAALIDLLCPDVNTGAQLAIAPAIIAAIISGVAALAAKSMEKKEPPQKQGGEGGINMQPTINPNATAMDKSKEAEAFATGGQKPTMDSILSGMQGAMTPVSKHNELVQKANAGKNVGNYPMSPEVAGRTAGQYGTGNLLTPDFGASGEDITKAGGKEGMSFDEKMQMAALVAQLGSAAAGPGAPPPPGTPRGGGIGMSPVFQQMTARQMYG